MSSWNWLAIIIYAVIWVPIIVFLWYFVSMAYPNLGKWKWGLLPLMIYLPIWKVIPVQLTFAYLCHSEDIKYADVKDVYALNHQGRWLKKDEAQLNPASKAEYIFESADKIVAYEPDYASFSTDQTKKMLFGVKSYQNGYVQLIFDSVYKESLLQAAHDKKYSYQPIALYRKYYKQTDPGDMAGYYFTQPFTLFEGVSDYSCYSPHQFDRYFIEVKEFLKVNYGDAK